MLCKNTFLLIFSSFCVAALVRGREDDAMPAHPLIKGQANCIPAAFLYNARINGLHHHADDEEE